MGGSYIGGLISVNLTWANQIKKFGSYIGLVLILGVFLVTGVDCTCIPSVCSIVTTDSFVQWVKTLIIEFKPAHVPIFQHSIDLKENRLFIYALLLTLRSAQFQP
jgi:hypothetical protein